jgi:hypothetical protein
MFQSYAKILSQRPENGITLSRDLQCVGYQGPRVKSGKFRKKISQKTRKRQLKTTYSGTEVLEQYCWELCFEFLDLCDLLGLTAICKEFRQMIKNSGVLWLNLYTRKWRPKKPFLSMYMGLNYDDYLSMYIRRCEAINYSLSTRGSIKELEDGQFEVVNDSMLRSFERGSIDSIRGTTPLPMLSCGQALGLRVAYFEATLKGCGSVGIASLKKDVKNNYGFGSEEHVGWKPLSYGYHGNDGDFVFNSGTADYGGEWIPFGPPWGAVNCQYDDDAPIFIVGCGLNYDTLILFYTLNGLLVDIAPTMVVESEYAAAISLHSFGDTVKLNFGRVPFLFDVETFVGTFANKK